MIVVDDASRDGSQRLLRSIASHVGERRFGTVFLPTNLGLTGVRNLGLQLARYRNVLFLDADNELVPAAIPVLYRAFRMTEAALVYGNLIDIDRGKADALRSNEVAQLTLTIDNYIDALALVDAAQALEIGGYVSDRSLDYWADWEFILHLIAEERDLVFVPIIVGRYHKLPFSMIGESAQRQGADLRRMRRIFSQTGTLEWDQPSRRPHLSSRCRLPRRGLVMIDEKTLAPSSPFDVTQPLALSSCTRQLHLRRARDLPRRAAGDPRHLDPRPRSTRWRSPSFSRASGGRSPSSTSGRSWADPRSCSLSPGGGESGQHRPQSAHRRRDQRQAGHARDLARRDREHRAPRAGRRRPRARRAFRRWPSASICDWATSARRATSYLPN